MPRGAKQQHVIRGADSAKRLCGPATELNETEPPLKRNVIQYYYWLENSTTDDTDYALHLKIARGVINIWRQVNPRLPLRDEKNVTSFFFDVSSKDKLWTVFRYFVWHHIVPVQVTFKNSHPHQGLYARLWYWGVILWVCQGEESTSTSRWKRVPERPMTETTLRGSFQLGSIDRAAVRSEKSFGWWIWKPVSRPRIFVVGRPRQKFLRWHIWSSTISCVVQSDKDTTFRHGVGTEWNFHSCWASLGNALILDLRNCGLLSPDVNIELLMMDKNKISRQMDAAKIKSESILSTQADSLVLALTGEMTPRHYCTVRSRTAMGTGSWGKTGGQSTISPSQWSLDPWQAVTWHIAIFHRRVSQVIWWHRKLSVFSRSTTVQRALKPSWLTTHRPIQVNLYYIP